jgi:hypothetical protein
MTDRLAELEAQAAALNAEIAALKGGPPTVQEPAPARREVTISQLLDEQDASDMPSLEELRKLFKIVRPRAPWKVHDEDRLFAGFRGAFRWIMSQGRIDRPNPKCDLDFFVGGCRTWLRDRGSMIVDVDVNAVMLAAMAAGDILFVIPNAALGHVAELGLHDVLNAGRAADMSGWKRVLETGPAPTASHPARAAAASQPVRYGF